jgi:hypothetical protein
MGRMRQRERERERERRGRGREELNGTERKAKKNGPLFEQPLKSEQPPS